MDRIDQILNHPVFKKSQRKLKDLEKNRKFCRHGMRHLLDVSRLGYIIILENGFSIPKDIIYAAGLLHDVGKYQQYEKGIPHALASAELAEGILADCGYDGEERRQICRAIADHSRKGSAEEEAVDSLDSVLYLADKASRNCFCCKHKGECSWPEELKARGLMA